MHMNSENGSTFDKQNRDVSSYILPSRIIERKVCEGSAGLFTMLAYLVQPVGFAFWICMCGFSIVLLCACVVSIVTDPKSCLLFLLLGIPFVCVSVKCTMGLPKILWSAHKTGELEVMVADFAGSEPVLAGKLYIGKRYLFSRTGDKVVKRSDVRFVSVRQKDSAIYYAKRPGQPYFGILCFVPYGYSKWEAKDLISRKLFAGEEQKQAANRARKEAVEAEMKSLVHLVQTDPNVDRAAAQQRLEQLYREYKSYD